MFKKVINILKEYLQNLIKSIIRDDYANAAGEMAYMTALGIFPFMLFLMAVFGWLGKTSFIDKVIYGLSTIAPQGVVGLIKGVLAEVVIFKSGKLMAIVGFFVTIFLTSNAIAVIIKGLNRNDGECPCANDSEDKHCPCSNYREHDHCCCTLYVKEKTE